ncbi:MAG: hypothetical protein L0Y62_00315, partial [Nitrospirae bacterium]|nr:hypothetical protein [Nitrospirota bacterium]
DIDIGAKKNLIYIAFDNINIDEIPLLSHAGVKGNGILSGDFKSNGMIGELKFRLNNAALKEIPIQNIALLAPMFNQIKGAIDYDNEKLFIRSLSLEGRDIYGRIKGEVKDGNADMKIEIMHEPSFEYKGAFLALMDKHRVSPGYYVININTRLQGDGVVLSF